MAAIGAPTPARPVLVIDTATSRAVVALGSLDGALLGVDEWDAGHRHAEELLARVAVLLAASGIGRPVPGSLAGIIVGTGPGGFTGLRVGLATARGIARAAAAPLIGVPTGDALAAAARAAGAAPADAPVAVLLPAGVRGRYLVLDGRATCVLGTRAGTSCSEEGAGEPARLLVAVDLAARAPAVAVARGDVARAGLAEALLALGAARLRAGEDDAATLAPEYVTLPRGVAHRGGGGGMVARPPVRLAHRADDPRRPGGRAGDREGELHDALAVVRLSQRARDQPPGPLPRRPGRARRDRVRGGLADGRRGARDDLRRGARVAPAGASASASSSRSSTSRLARGAREATLEVRLSNLGARRLYEKYGFRPVGIRPRYYSDDHEDALIMTTEPLESPAMTARLARLRAEIAASPGPEAPG